MICLLSARHKNEHPNTHGYVLRLEEPGLKLRPNIFCGSKLAMSFENGTVRKEYCVHGILNYIAYWRLRVLVKMSRICCIVNCIANGWCQKCNQRLYHSIAIYEERKTDFEISRGV